MVKFLSENGVVIFNGDCLDVMKKLPANSVEAIVTDPPYGLDFMGKHWDYDVPTIEIWKEAYRILKPGAHILVFGGTRTYHRLVVNIEDAGFEIRDQIQWIYGSGFPKSLDVSKAIDKMAGEERQITGYESNVPTRPMTKNWEKSLIMGEGTKNVYAQGLGGCVRTLTAPATDAAKQWDGWGTALKPANEPICLARKPISEKTVAANVLKWGTGALNIDASRVETGDKLVHGGPLVTLSGDERQGKALGMLKKGTPNTFQQNSNGRWPANVILTHHPECEMVGVKEVKGNGNFPMVQNTVSWKMSSKGKALSPAHKMGKETIEDWNCHPDCPFKLFPHSTSGAMKKPYTYKNTGFSLGAPAGETKQIHESNEGSAARFFYCAKASRSEREAGCENLPLKQVAYGNQQTAQLKRGEPLSDSAGVGKGGVIAPTRNHHPTVKPIKLIEYLIKLITPPGGVVLDPFMGSGSTLIAAKNLGFRSIGIEKEEEYCQIAKGRLSAK